MLLLQKQGKKEIDTTPISHLYSVGECHPEPVEIVLERFFGDADLSGWQFRVYGTNAAHEPVYQDLQIHRTHEKTICLRWKVERTFTALAGVLHLELHALSPDTENAACIHYPMGDIWLSPSVCGTGMPLIRRMQDIYCQMQDLYHEMTVLSLHLPQISEENGTWMLFDVEPGAYVDTGIASSGEDPDLTEIYRRLEALEEKIGGET